MEPIITSPDKFVKQFNAKLPGVYRQITVQDIRAMTDCGLIRRYGYYIYSDLETARAVLQYEQLIEKRMKKPPEEDKLQILFCKLCGDPLPTQPEGKKGRPREYCLKCEKSRQRERYRTWQARKKKGVDRLLARM